MESAVSSIVSAVFIAAPLTFIAGWLACKTLLKMPGPRTSDATPMIAPEPATTRELNPDDTIQRPDGRDLLARALEQASQGEPRAEVTTQVTETHSNRFAAESELTELKEALAERDHQISELKAQIQDLPDYQQLSPVNRGTSDAPDELLRELEQLKHENLLITGRLHRAEADADKHQRHMVTWRRRAKPLVKQCRQQRSIIVQLREQLRSGVAEDKPGITVEIPADDLQALRGIGPALEKRMNGQGIFCYRQIAAMSETELVELGQALGIGRNRTLSGEWLAQAKALVGVTVGNEADADAPAPVSEPA